MPTQSRKVTTTQIRKNSLYTNLISSVSSEMQSGMLAAQKALEYQRLKTYWSIGKIINGYLGKHPDADHRGVAFLKQVSEDINRRAGLSITHDTLTRTIQFNREYPAFPAKTPLTFSHYLVLMRIHDPGKRVRLERRAVKESMPVARMKREVALLMRTPGGASSEKLSVERGEPFIYALKVETDISGNRIVRIDCGFKILKNLSGARINSFGGGRIVRAAKTGDRYEIFQNQRMSDKRYTYPAIVTKLVDGDTFDACVDVGFGIWINERFRLRGINAPEMGTPEGQQAKAFVQRLFKTYPRIVIRSSKAGMYGRWLADVFALKNETDPVRIARQGEYVNQMLLDQGFAEVYGK